MYVLKVYKTILKFALDQTVLYPTGRLGERERILFVCVKERETVGEYDLALSYRDMLHTYIGREREVFVCVRERKR